MVTCISSGGTQRNFLALLSTGCRTAALPAPCSARFLQFSSESFRTACVCLMSVTSKMSGRDVRSRKLSWEANLGTDFNLRGIVHPACGSGVLLSVSSAPYDHWHRCWHACYPRRDKSHLCRRLLEKGFDPGLFHNEAFHGQAPPLGLVLPEGRGAGRAQRDFSSPRAAREHLQDPMEPHELFPLPLPFSKRPRRCCPAPPAPCT